MYDTDTDTLKELATEALGWFETAKRGDDDYFTRTKEGAPEWVTQIIFAAHHGQPEMLMLPDDWRYSKIEDALQWISDSDDPEDTAGEFADGAVDTYTRERIAWLSSHQSRADYCDEAAAELGGYSDGEYGRGGGERLGIIDMIGQGQYVEAQEVYNLVLRALEEVAAQRER